ncbi:hypothetical protein FOZ62_019821 [Perkinsus olseni]|uniref:Uncharacterized protein n=1 Tax=Perkinsus olseni TaxID=32597 RepID=A0A7J6P1V0_PEROL|nr:hypothetical protein FOZ62_019821 [Perkinsus olseni]
MSSTVDTQEATAAAAAGGEKEAAVSNPTGSLRILNRGNSLLDGSNGSQSLDAAATDCLEVSFRDEQQQQQVLSPGQVFEALNQIGDVRWIDFSNFHLNRTIVVAYFDLRAAQRAYTRLNEAELSASAEYVPLPESEDDRKVVLSVTSTDSFDTIRKELTQFGDLHRMSFQDSSIVAEFYDTRARASIQASLGALGFKQLGPAIGPALRARSTSLIGSGRDRINLHASGSSGGSCSGAQRAAMMGVRVGVGDKWTISEDHCGA